MKYAHTVVLPPVHLAGNELNFFCDLTRRNALDELLATCDTWLDIKEAQQPLVNTGSEDACYDWARKNMLATLLAIQQASTRQKVLERVLSDFLVKHQFPEVKAALNEHYHADIEQLYKNSAQTNRFH